MFYLKEMVWGQVNFGYGLQTIHSNISSRNCSHWSLLSYYRRILEEQGGAFFFFFFKEMEVLAICGILQSMFKIFLKAYEKYHSIEFLGSFSLEVNPGESEPLLSCDSCWEPTGLLITPEANHQDSKEPGCAFPLGEKFMFSQWI